MKKDNLSFAREAINNLDKEDLNLNYDYTIVKYGWEWSRGGKAIKQIPEEEKPSLIESEIPKENLVLKEGIKEGDKLSKWDKIEEENIRNRFLKEYPKYLTKGLIVKKFKGLYWVKYPYEEKNGFVEEIKGDFYYGKVSPTKMSCILLVYHKSLDSPGKIDYKLCFYDENNETIRRSYGILEKIPEDMFELIDKEEVFENIPDFLSLLTKNKTK